MSTHKYFDRICCVILAFTLIITVVFMNAESFGIQKASTVKEYETRLFDTSYVHTLNIVMEDWDGFLSTCTNEEYTECSAVIDGEAYTNIAIRAKGNSSLDQVKDYGNDRYSFKIEFDHYDSSTTYYGLDKLSLNNIIQDNTYMKDYLTYQMMGYFGVNSPLCSYVQISVNGEEWGLYLAVESIEESFLQRNYGNDYGELYKPDSADLGGGRGNGNKFDINNIINGQENTDSDSSSESTQPDVKNEQGKNDTSAQGENNQLGQPPGGQMQQGNREITIDQIKKMIENLDDESLESAAKILNYENSEKMLEALNSAKDVQTFLNGKTIMDLASIMKGPSGDVSQDGMAPPEINNNSDANDNSNDNANENVQAGNKGRGMSSMGSSDVSLIYTDDEYSSYPNIFDNAKTDITDEDKDRLISSLKQLNNNSNIINVVNVKDVIRYFVVHNFVCNFDSYTGTMIHNYYLYENKGQLSMIPWDYNLAFGGFGGNSDATNIVNYPIDSPVSGGTTDSRPMLNWIFESEEYTELYHQYFSEFIEKYFDSGYFEEIIDSVKSMISPYVKSDPTKFCTYDEFETGIDTLKEFCLLRAESINAQLDGTIATTSEEQNKDTLIDASGINITDMGSAGGGMDKSKGNQNSQVTGEQQSDNNQGNITSDNMQEPSGNNQQGPNNSPPQITDDESKSAMKPGISEKDGTSDSSSTQQSQSDGENTKSDKEQGELTGDNNPQSTKPNGNNKQDETAKNSVSTSTYILIAVCVVVLIGGILFALLYKRFD